MTDEQCVAWACLGGTLALGVGVLLLQKSTLHDICTRSATWPHIDATGRAVAAVVKGRIAPSGKAAHIALTDYATRNEQMQKNPNGITTMLYSDTLECISDPLKGDVEGVRAQDRIRSIALVLASLPKNATNRRTTVAIPRVDGSVREHELYVRLVVAPELLSTWIVTFHWA